jgi:two-component system, OmpR family, phosphate regulon response regulator PhoB
MAKSKVLIVEDDRDLVEILTYNIKQAGYEVLIARDGQDGLRQAQIKTPEIVILDLMLPVVDGLEVCRQLRSDPATRDVLIMMLTAKSEESDQVVGLSMGADDYVTKPFSVKVLVERMKALERRRSVGSDEAQIVASQGITIDRRAHRALAGERALQLTLSEFRLLDVMLRQPGRAFTRAELIDGALGEDTMVLERTIDVHIRSLRQKLEEYADLIETVRGVGYRFKEPSNV